MQNLDFILRISPSNVSLLVIKKMDFEDKKTNVFYKTFKNNESTIKYNVNFDFKILKLKILNLIDEAKKDLCISQIDNIFVSYCFDSFKTSKQTYNSKNNKLKLEEILNNNKVLKINDHTLINFYVNHHIDINQSLIYLYWIPTSHYENITNILNEAKCEIKHFIISKCFINEDSININEKTILLDFEYETFKTFQYSGSGLIEDETLNLFKNHLNLKEMIEALVKQFNVSFQIIENLFSQQNYSDEQILKLNFDKNNIFKTTIVKIKDVKEKIKAYLYDCCITTNSYENSKTKVFLEFKSKYYFLNKVFDEWIIEQKQFIPTNVKRFESDYSTDIYECMNDYIKMIINN